MQLKSDPHIFSGMQRDMSISKQKSESLYDAKNIRFTARDGDTMLSITNEKGTTELNLYAKRISGYYEQTTISGIYLGHCVVDNYVVLFTTTGTTDYIYKIYQGVAKFPGENPVLEDDDTYSTEYIVEILYQGHLNFDANHPIETLGVYENDDIQKVYWTDGINQPRYIFTGNYPTTRVTSGKDTQFDFVPTLNLTEEVVVERKEGSGSFVPGTIQYAFTYYNKYGRQSNIFYTTLLYYISYQDRAGNPEETVANSFRIEIHNLQKQDFDFLRVYSIHRTSENAVPTVKRVIDVDLSTASYDSGNKGFYTSFIDNGLIGDTVDPTELLYMGGEEILAQTMTTKDNTLFFGNLQLVRKAIDSDYKNNICAVGKTESNISTLLNPTEFLGQYSLQRYDIANDYYSYASSLNWSSPGFKNREHYRLGVQFQHESGKWSEPIFIGDYTFNGTVNPRLDIGTTETNLYLPNLDITIPIPQQLLNDGYKKARPLVIFPTIEDRLVLTQGVLCPTVFSKSNRKNSSPFSQSSWFFRPSLPKGNDCIPPVLDGVSEGTYLAYRHLEDIAGAKYSNNGNINLKSIEIQGSYGAVEDEPNNSNEYSYSYATPPEDKQFFVDQSIVTMHSPDIEWDSNFDLLNYTDWKLNIVGAALITSICSDVDIQVSTPSNLEAKGFIRKRYNTSDSFLAGGALSAGLFWEDYMVCAEPKDGKTNYYLYNDKDSSNNHNGTDLQKVNYLIHPWHRTGSLNNDENRSDGQTSTATLKRKVISNLKFSSNTKFFNYSGISSGQFDGKLNISKLQIFNSDQVSLVKIPLENKSFVGGDLNYYGNVDTMLSGNQANVYITEGNTPNSCNDIITYTSSTQFLPGTSISINKRNNVLPTVTTPVRMKYKSSRHLVFGLTPNADKSVNILPRVQGVPDDSYEHADRDKSYADLMFWVDSSFLSDNTVKNKVIDVTIYDNFDKAQQLSSFYTSVEQGDYLILLSGGNDGQQGSITTPVIVTASVTNGALDSTTYVTDQNILRSKFLVGQYYSSAKDESGDLVVYKQDTTAAEVYYLVESSMSELTNDVTVEGLDPFKVHQQVIPNSAPDAAHDDVPEAPNAVRNAYLLVGELYREPISWTTTDYPYFGGKTDDATKSNLWIPAGRAVRLTEAIGGTLHLKFTQGDTWYTRYDCLKTYPFTMEDENSIVEIGSFLCESRVNGDGRYDRNRGQISNLNMSPINFNLLNPVYNNHDNFFNYRILDDDYYNLNSFSNQITWSKEKQNAAEIDLWTNVTMANTFDLDGTMGAINALRTWKDTIYCFQDNAISIISFNPRVQIPTSDGVPIEISNSYKLEGKVYISDSIGCSNKQTIAITPSGIYFIDPNSKELYNLAGNQLTAVSSAHGFSNWFKTHTLTNTFYDKNRNDLYVLNGTDCIVYSELLGQFTSFMDYNGTPAMFNINDDFYAFRNGSNLVKMYSLFTGAYNDFFGNSKEYWIEFISNQDSAIDKIFSTIDMRVDFRNVSSSNAVIHDEFFDKLKVTTEYQDTGNVTLSKSIGPNRADAKKKFRVWRVNIPRNAGTPLGRIRNTWSSIKFTKTTNLNNVKMELHDLSVQYFI